MNAVSLFAGVGGFDLALERSGVPVVAAVEIDKQARGVLAHQFPNTKLFNDIKDVTGNDLLRAGFIPESGIITGGFPCQDLSVAGKRAGLAGERSGLFWEIARLLDDLQPRWFVLENVPGLLSSNAGRDMGIVLGTLAELGYGVAYRVLDAQNFGVPQRRRRVFIVGSLGDSGRAPAEILAIRQGLFRDTSQSDTAREQTTGSASQSVASPLLARDHKGIDAEGAAGGHLIFYGNRVDDVRIQDDKINTLQARMGTGGNNMPLVLAASDVAGQGATALMTESMAIDQYNATISETRHTLRAAGKISTGVIIFSHTQGLDAQPSGSVSPTLRRNGNGQAVSDAVQQVRRLTPVECERLQGFPDDWTKYRVDEKKGLIEQADSPRYKQMGNAVAVPCVEWIINRLAARKIG